MYQSLNPPAVGFCLLQGPIVDGFKNDVATFKGRLSKVKKIFQ
jgi:hypothetical protein